ncbi:glycosyltransferase family 2 protein [Evansella clarkii]|uniref:glycosyltransferase family 2 protein n=1 Tax=Evansella clarkii TaxID=79879 RepID=UPI000B438CC3|nr:glycosyltransferase [Evansella clarkii]
MAKISIIVPVYNLEKFIAKCVESILSQTFTDFQLILVNDGSTDNSGKLCDYYAAIDQRVKVIHKENGGVASSRNAGLTASEGKYIGFVDNDDYIHESMYEILYNTAVIHSSDIVVCDFKKVMEGQFIDISSLQNPLSVRNMNNIDALNQLYTENGLTFVCPWNKIYKRELFDDIKYEEGFINDDETIAHKLLYESDRTTYINLQLYYYVQREGSQMNSPFNIKRLDAVYILKSRALFFKEKNEKDLQQKALKHFLEKFFWYYSLAGIHIDRKNKEMKKLKSTFDSSFFELITHREFGWKQKIYLTLFRISPSMYDVIKNLLERPKQEMKP